MGIFYVAIKPEGTGRIHKLPFFKDPIITYNLTHNDKVKLAKGLKYLSIMLLNAGSTKIYPSIINSNIICSKDDLESLPKVINPKIKFIYHNLFLLVQSGKQRIMYCKFTR